MKLVERMVLINYTEKVSNKLFYCVDKVCFLDFRKGNPAPLVKFSNDQDLDSEECLRLLNKYTPPHLKRNKTMRKLFVRYTLAIYHND